MNRREFFAANAALAVVGVPEPNTQIGRAAVLARLHAMPGDMVRCDPLPRGGRRYRTTCVHCGEAGADYREARSFESSQVSFCITCDKCGHLTETKFSCGQWSGTVWHGLAAEYYAVVAQNEGERW